MIVAGIGTLNVGGLVGYSGSVITINNSFWLYDIAVTPNVGTDKGVDGSCYGNSD